MKRLFLILTLFVFGVIVPSYCVKAVSIGGINVDTVSEGDGLYEDEYEEGRYVYKGGMPNNYILLNSSKAQSYNLILDNRDVGQSFSKKEDCQKYLEMYLADIPGANGTCTLKNDRYRIILNNINLDQNYVTEKECQNALNENLQYDPNSKGTCVLNEYYSNLYRIVSIEKDGTLKLIKNSAIGQMKWNNNGYTDWENSSLSEYLNNEWYENLDEDVKKIIVNYNWSVGEGSDYSNNRSLLDGISSENSKHWKGNVGLITVSDYFRAVSNMNECGYEELFIYNRKKCREIDWIFLMSRGYMATITNDANLINAITSGHDTYGGYILSYSYDVDFTINPSLYITANIKLEGSGTDDDPYRIINKENKEDNNGSDSPQIVNVPSTSLYGSVIISVLGILCVIFSVFLMRRVTKKNN